MHESGHLITILTNVLIGVINASPTFSPTCALLGKSHHQ
jgi:hypothetical protein